ncbi:hypothetical protein BH10ACT3_BH10ACT3_22140 [soil metagenome]
MEGSLRTLIGVSTPTPPSTSAGDPARVVAAVAAAPAGAAALILIAEPPVWAAILVMALGVAAAVVLTIRLVVRPLTASAITASLQRSQMELQLLDERADRDFRERLDQALSMTEAEPATLRTGLRAVAELIPEADISLLLSVPDEPRVGWQVRLVRGALEPAMPLEGTPHCLALAKSTTTMTMSSSALDACAHLQDPMLEVSATCIPLRLGDRTLGTVCVTSAPGELIEPAVLERIEWAIDRTGVRVAEQRLQRGPSIAGRPDPVTGLPGPSALRHQLRDLVRTLSPFCVAIVAVDAYDEMRYDHSDEVAEDALRLVADVLCTTLRPDDLVCRIDGPRFAVVLAECTARQATAAMERVRESLALVLTMEADPPFTCSAGIVESHRATSLEEIVELASGACIEAHSAGGNRVSLAGEA